MDAITISKLDKIDERLKACLRAQVVMLTKLNHLLGCVIALYPNKDSEELVKKFNTEIKDLLKEMNHE